MKKRPIIISALIFSSLSIGNITHASEIVEESHIIPMEESAQTNDESLTYDDKNLDDIFLEDLNQEEEISDSETNIELDNEYLDGLNRNPKILYYDDRPLDRVFDDVKANESFYEKPDFKPSNKIKDGYIYQVIDGREYKTADKWIKIDNKTYYADSDGKASVGLKKIGGKDYYFEKDKTLATDKDIIADGGKYRAASDGAISQIEKAKEGWAGLGDKSYYFGADGKLLRGFTDLGQNRYYFDKIDGLMLRNQIINEGIEKIHTGSNGVAHLIGWDYYNGKLSYVNQDGSLAKGLKNIDGMIYGFDDNGKIYNRQNKKINGQWYYFNKYGEATKSNGKFYTGWVGDRYYFPDGKPAEGIQTIDGKTYIFHELTLQKQRNVEKVFGHKRYRTDSNGVARYIGEVNQYPAQAGTKGQFAPGFSSYLNRKTPYLTQNDPRWKNMRYSVGTMGANGCGPTAMAMVLNRKLNRNDIYPTTTAIDARPYTAYNGTDWQYLIEGPEIYGLKTYEVPVNEKAFIQALKKNPIIVRVGNGYFINSGHYLVIDSYKDGKFIINDPFYSQKNTLEAHSFWRLKQEVTVAWEVK